MAQAQHLTLAQTLESLAVKEVELFCPIAQAPPKTDGKELDRHAAGWAVRQGLCAPDALLTRAGLGELITAGMPLFSREAAVALTCYTYWAFLWDDHLDGLVQDPDAAIAMTGEANRVMTEPEAAPLIDDPFVRSLRDIRRMTEECLGPDGVHAMRAEHTQWLGGQLWKLALHRRPAPPTVGEWLRMRWQKAGTGVLAALVPPGGGYALSPADQYDPLVRAFTQAVFYPCTIINELGSLLKEQANGQGHVNLVFAVAAEHGIGLAEALLKVWELYERFVGLMSRLQERLLRDSRPSVARYAAELPQWLPATVNWMSRSVRYLTLLDQDSPGGTPLAPPALSMTGSPRLWDPADLTPPPYPDIAWLWTRLD
ncbi:terpene synthase family protein [Streptomyces coeruleorubidus]